MIPSSPHHGSAIHRHRLAIRRSAAALAAAIVIGGAPLVARALGDDPVPAASAIDSPSAPPEARPPGNPAQPRRPEDLVGPGPGRQDTGRDTGRSRTRAREPAGVAVRARHPRDDRDVHVGRTRPASRCCRPCSGSTSTAGTRPQRSRRTGAPSSSQGCRPTCCPLRPSRPVRRPSSGRPSVSVKPVVTTRSPTRPGSTAGRTSSIGRPGTRSPSATPLASSGPIPPPRRPPIRTPWPRPSSANAAPAPGRTADATSADAPAADGHHHRR